MDDGASQVSLWRLYALRIIYTLIGFALTSQQWAYLIALGPDAPLMQGIAHSMFAALGLAALLGIPYPLQMLPVLFFEFIWKGIWLVAVALRFSLQDRLNPSFMSIVWECLPVVILPFIIPWRYVIANYVRRRFDRWR